MHLRNFACACLLAGIALSMSSIAADPVDVPAPNRQAPSEQDIERAIDLLKADPNLAGERTIRTLRWRDREQKPVTTTGDRPAFLRWIVEFFSWLGETARVLVWLAAALLVALLAVWIVRFVRERELRLKPAATMFAPTHVRDLDIRPESLPDDIGQAAFELWQRGEHRAALSLLYRGLLSRLAHKFAVPIRQSSTEGECGTLARKHLPAGSHDYVASLIRTWQGAVYGGNEPQTNNMQQLCVNFAVALDRVPAALIVGTPDPGADV